MYGKKKEGVIPFMTGQAASPRNRRADGRWRKGVGRRPMKNKEVVVA
jgi:hypothetical protein